MIRLWLLLRLLLLLTDGGDGDGEEESSEEEAGQEGEGSSEGEGEEEEEITDPKAKVAALQDQVRRLAMKLDKKDAELRKRDKRIKELEDQAKASGESTNADLLTARRENSFLRTAIHRGDIEDLDTTWDLAQAKGFLDAVKPDGEGMDQSIERLVEQYPWLISDAVEEESDEDRPSSLPKTRNPRATKPGQRVANKARLQKRFPALRGRR